MAKIKTVFVCSACGHQSARWLGKCPNCDEWNTFTEELIEPEPAATKAGKATQPVLPVRLSEVQTRDYARISSGSKELDRVLGGGIIPASMILLCGDPGIGKSTILLQAAEFIARGEKVLYISAEESAAQIRMRADRLGASNESNLYILSETGIEEILEGIRQVSPKIVIVDSIQTVYANETVSAPGTVSQVRNCASLLMRMAKSSDIAVFLVGHVTKEGSIAGPKVLEHMVDTVLYFEGEKNHSYRILRAVKNRFGSTNEVGIFEMCDDGICAVEDVSGILLTAREEDVPGTAVLCSVEGTRPMLVEIQALISNTCFGNPRRMSTGFDYNRMVMILAVLEKRMGLPLGNQDAYVNVAGGLRLDEPAADLAVASAIASSATNRSIREHTAMIGEIGLTGEVRPVNRMDVRIAECIKCGFDRIIIPAGNKFNTKYKNHVIPVKTIADALNQALN